MYKSIKILLFIVLFIIPMIILPFLFSNSKTTSKEYLCIDGDGGTNLEGFMCEKEYMDFNSDLESTIFIVCLLLVLLFAFFAGLGGLR